MGGAYFGKNGSGALRCWGANSDGQVGDGTFTDRSIVPSSNILTGVQSVSTSGGHTCALMTTGGVRCWGDAFEGQLGDGTILPIDPGASPGHLPVGLQWRCRANLHSFRNKRSNQARVARATGRCHSHINRRSSLAQSPNLMDPTVKWNKSRGLTSRVAAARRKRQSICVGTKYWGPPADSSGLGPVGWLDSEPSELVEKPARSV